MKKIRLISQNKWCDISINLIISIVLIWYAISYTFYRQDPLAVFVVQSRLILDGIPINYIDQPGIWLNYLSIPIIYASRILRGASDGFPGYYEANQWLYLLNILIMLWGFWVLSKDLLSNSLNKVIAALILLNPIILCTMGSADGYAYALSILAVAYLKFEVSLSKSILTIALLVLAASAKSIYLVVYFIPVMVVFNYNVGLQNTLKILLKSILIYTGLLLLVILLFNFPILEHLTFLRNPKIANFENKKLLESTRNTFYGLIQYPEIYLPFIFVICSSITNLKIFNRKLIITFVAVFMLSTLMLFIASARPYKAFTYLLVMVPIYFSYIKLLHFKGYVYTINTYLNLLIKISIILLLIYFQSAQYRILKNEKDFEKAKFQSLSLIVQPYSNLNEFYLAEKGGENYLNFQSNYQIADAYSRNLYSKGLSLEAFEYFKNRHNFSK